MGEIVVFGAAVRAGAEWARVWERLDRLVERARVVGGSEADWRAVLARRRARIYELELAMVWMALAASPGALEALEGFDTRGRARRLEAMRLVCEGECRRRMRKDKAWGRAA